MPAQENLSDILRQLVDETDGEDISFGDLVDALHTRSYGPLLILPAVMAASPIGAIPGVPVVTGTLIVILAVQMVAGLRHPWLPRRLLNFDFQRKRLKGGVEKVLPWVHRAERLVTYRLGLITHPAATRFIALICIGLGLLFFPLALVPFGVAVPASGVLALALGITTRDGVLVLLGVGFGAAAAWLSVVLWPF